MAAITPIRIWKKQAITDKYSPFFDSLQIVFCDNLLFNPYNCGVNAVTTLLFNPYNCDVNGQLLQHLCSPERFIPYQRFCGGDDTRAMQLYQYNIELSESLYPPLSLLEITLRNAIHRELTNNFNTPEWYDTFAADPALAPLDNMIQAAKTRHTQERKSINPGNIVAALNFGFWTALFNHRYERSLWGKLRFAFPNMPRRQRTRANVSRPINRIRQRLRNRVYHYEPISWNINRTQRLYDEVYLVLE